MCFYILEVASRGRLFWLWIQVCETRSFLLGWSELSEPKSLLSGLNVQFGDDVIRVRKEEEASRAGLHTESMNVQCAQSLCQTPRHRHIELQKDGNTKQLSCPSLIYSLSFKAEGQHVQTGGRSSSPKPEQQSDLLQWQRTESCDTYSLLRAKLPISHQVNLIGEVHTHGQLDEQVDAETIATLRDDGLTWTHKHSLISVIQLYIYGAQTHAQKTGQIGSGRMAC